MSQSITNGLWDHHTYIYVLRLGLELIAPPLAQPRPFMEDEISPVWSLHHAKPHPVKKDLIVPPFPHRGSLAKDRIHSITEPSPGGQIPLLLPMAHANPFNFMA